MSKCSPSYLLRFSQRDTITFGRMVMMWLHQLLRRVIVVRFLNEATLLMWYSWFLHQLTGDASACSLRIISCMNQLHAICVVDAYGQTVYSQRSSSRATPHFESLHLCPEWRTDDDSERCKICVINTQGTTCCWHLVNLYFSGRFTSKARSNSNRCAKRTKFCVESFQFRPLDVNDVVSSRISSDTSLRDHRKRSVEAVETGFCLIWSIPHGIKAKNWRGAGWETQYRWFCSQKTSSNKFLQAERAQKSSDNRVSSKSKAQKNSSRYKNANNVFIICCEENSRISQKCRWTLTTSSATVSISKWTMSSAVSARSLLASVFMDVKRMCVSDEWVLR